jgi:hypothetical protein
MHAITAIILAGALSAGVDPAHGAPASRNQNVAPPSTLSEEEIRSQTLAYLSAIDTPIPPATWEALGPRAEPVLRELISDGSNFPTRRAKAIDGLAVVAGAAAASTFREVAGAESESLVVRLAALRGLGRVSQPQALMSDLAPLLAGANDSRVRAYAGEVLIRRSGRRACATVRAQAESELPERQGHFERALSLCKGK